MTARRFPLLLSATLAALTLVLTQAASAAALSVGWPAATSLGAGDSTVGRPPVASTRGAITVVWSQATEGNQVLLVSRKVGAGTWSAPAPLSDPGEDVAADLYTVIADDAGNVTALWKVYGTWHLKSRVLLAGQSDWTPTETIDATGGVSGVDAEPYPGGRVMIAWGSYHGGNSIRVRVRDANAPTWGDPVDVEPTTDSPQSVTLGTNERGDAALLWMRQIAGVSPDEFDVQASRLLASTGTWSQAETVDGPAGAAGDFSSVAIAPDGAATGVWTDGTTFAGKATTIGADPGDSWDTTPEVVTEPGTGAILNQVASDSGGDIVLVMQTLVYNPDPVVMYSTTKARIRVRDATTGSWSPLTAVGDPDDYSGGPMLTTNANRDMALLFLRGDALDTSRLADNVFGGVQLSLSLRPDGAGSFSAPATVHTGALSGFSMPATIALDEAGNPAAAWGAADAGTNRHIEALAGDATAPELRAVTVPEAAVTGTPVAVSADPFDVWSSLTTAWSFGDGSSAASASAEHTYTAPGRYTVTVTSTDAFGHKASERREILVSAPPTGDDDSGDDPPKRVLPPVIEARLAGRTVTLNAKLALKKGKRCTGTIKATTAFGGRTYKTTLRLVTKGGACRATGTIRLRKTPSLRTKLQVTLKGSQTKTRTLTTRRG